MYDIVVLFTYTCEYTCVELVGPIPHRGWTNVCDGHEPWRFPEPQTIILFYCAEACFTFSRDDLRKFSNVYANFQLHLERARYIRIVDSSALLITRVNAFDYGTSPTIVFIDRQNNKFLYCLQTRFGTFKSAVWRRNSLIGNGILKVIL